MSKNKGFSIKCYNCVFYVHRKHFHSCEKNRAKIYLGFLLQEPLIEHCTHFKDKAEVKNVL